MKINIANGDIQGYKTVEHSLEGIHDGQCVEILAPTVVNRIHYTQLQDVLKLWHSKLRVGGVLTLGGYDLVEFCKRVIRYGISKEEKNKLIAESGCFLPLDEITELVQAVGFKVLKRQLNGISYVLELTRE
jgi:hypothetical protein